jgi:hypothetical protein
MAVDPRVGARIEIEDDRFALEAGEADLITILVGQGEVGSACSGLEHYS